MFQWKDSFCLPLSHSLKQSDDFELFVSENVAFSPGKKKKKKIQPINLRRVMHLFVFFFTNEKAKILPSKLRERRNTLLKMP